MEPEFIQSERYGMGTVVTHRVFGTRRGEALRAAEEETARLERVLSRFLPDSDVSRVNASAGREPAAVGDETLEVLSLARKFSECCSGAFDVTVAPLVSLWRDRRGTLKPPDTSEIRKALPLVDYSALALDPVRRTAGLRKKGQSLDLGGVGKGYASDKILDVFKNHGITSAFTNFGGNVSALGTKPDGSPWRVGIRHPRRSGALIGAVEVADRSVVTSGDDQRYFVASDGKRYHHILDPRTGYPSESGLISVTVVMESAAAADALSTALFVLGLNKGLAVLKTCPGAEAVLAGTNCEVYITEGLAGAFTAADGVRARIIDA